MCLISAETHWTIAEAGLLVSNWLAAFSHGLFLVRKLVKAPRDGARQIFSYIQPTLQSPLLLKHCQDFSKSHWHPFKRSKGFPRAFRCIFHFPMCVLAHIQAFWVHFPKCSVFVLLEHFKTNIVSAPNYAPLNYYTFSLI